jgi:hypothetical protein
MFSTEPLCPADYLIQADGSITLNRAGQVVSALTEAERWARAQLAAASVGAALASVVHDDGAGLRSFALKVVHATELDDNGRPFETYSLEVTDVEFIEASSAPVWARDAEGEVDADWAAEAIAERLTDAADEFDFYSVFDTSDFAGDEIDEVKVSVSCELLAELVKTSPISGRSAFALLFPSTALAIGLNEPGKVGRLHVASPTPSWVSLFGELIESLLGDPALAPVLKAQLRSLASRIGD